MSKSGSGVGNKNKMLIGEYTHKIDTKGRVSLPAKWRKELGRKLIITRGLDSCLFIFTQKEWTKLSQMLSSASWLKRDARAFNRRIFGGATEVEVDRVGRILFPEFLKEEAGFINTDKAILVGVDNRVEVWSAKSWKEYRSVTDKKADEIAEKIGNYTDGK